MDLRNDARDDFIDSSNRQIRLVDTAMQLYFESIRQNIDYLVSQPLLRNADGSLKNYSSANSPGIAQGALDKQIFDFYAHLANSNSAYSNIIFGNNCGGFVSWPDNPSRANYDPRERPWYKAALSSPGKTLCTDTYYYAHKVGASFAGLIVRPIRSVVSGLQGITEGDGDLTQGLHVRGNDETA